MPYLRRKYELGFSVQYFITSCSHKSKNNIGLATFMNAFILTIGLIFTGMNTPTPEIKLPKNQWVTLPQTQFYHATNGQTAPQPTQVKLKYDDQYLHVQFDCAQNPFVGQNAYNQHNTELWNQEVFELFIAEGTTTPTRYLELEINPNNALFVGWIDNPSGENPANLEFVVYEKSQIRHEIKIKKDAWEGQMQIPWALLGGKKENYRLNFFRIISLESHPEPNWKGSPADCAYLCWNSTLSGPTPRFHRPAAFGTLHLE